MASDSNDNPYNENSGDGGGNFKIEPRPGITQPSSGEKKFLLFQASRSVKIGLAVAVLVLLIVGALTSSFIQNADKSKASSDAMDSSDIKDRKAVAPFDLTDASGNKTPFAAYKGKVVILSFWASWCPPCLVELPTFAQIQKRFGADRLVVVPVNVDTGDVGINFQKEFWAKNNFGFPAYFDPNRQVAEAFEVDNLPANFVMDREGRIVFSGFGAMDWNEPETVAIIEGLVHEK